MDCDMCQSPLPTDGGYITCNHCSSNLHFNCAGVSARTWKSKSQIKKDEWKCTACRDSKAPGSGGSLDDEEFCTDPKFIALKNFIDSMFKRQERKIVERLDKWEALLNQVEDRRELLNLWILCEIWKLKCWS